MYHEHVVEIQDREFNPKLRHMIALPSIPFNLELEEGNSIGERAAWREQLNVQEPSCEWYSAQNAQTIEEDDSQTGLHQRT